MTFRIHHPAKCSLKLSTEKAGIVHMRKHASSAGSATCRTGLIHGRLKSPAATIHQLLWMRICLRTQYTYQPPFSDISVCVCLCVCARTHACAQTVSSQCMSICKWTCMQGSRTSTQSFRQIERKREMYLHISIYMHMRFSAALDGVAPEACTRYSAELQQV